MKSKINSLKKKVELYGQNAHTKNKTTLDGVMVNKMVMGRKLMK
jgi:hypothetical protein